MISTSQVSLFQNGSSQVSSLDSNQLRITRQNEALPPEGVQAGATEQSLVRQAAYRYSSQEQLAFSSSGQVNGESGSATHTSAELIERSAGLLLQGQQALTVSRAALGGEAVGESRGGITGGVAVTAGRYMFHSESESRSFASTGSISLANGDTIDFTLSLRQSQSRTYEYSELIQIQERPLTDPLVINFGASTARLTDSLFEFDMNGDGQTSQFASLGSGSGYLVFDRNGNGKVDDGSELFGPMSGSGFSELAKYDDDGNRWIDANDEVFKLLSVWVQTDDGGQALRSLEEVGVQALYVGSIEDRFTLTNPQGVPLGQIKASGIYLTTDGEVRTLEELDLAEQNTESAPAVMTSLGGGGGNTNASGSRNDSQNGNDRVNEKIEAIQSALKKLNEIRKQQQDFIENSKNQGGGKSPLNDYFTLIDRLRLSLLNSQDEKKQAASRYLEFAR